MTVQRAWLQPESVRVIRVLQLDGGVPVHGHGVPHPATYGWRLLGNSNRDFHAANEIWDLFQQVP